MANRRQLFFDLLRYVEGGDANRPMSIFIDGASWDFEAQDIKNLLMAFLFVVPTLRKERNSALKERETLQERNSGETLSFEVPKWEYMVTVIGNFPIPELDFAGKQGWELVSVVKNTAYFKRPK